MVRAFSSHQAAQAQPLESGNERDNGTQSQVPTAHASTGAAPNGAPSSSSPSSNTHPAPTIRTSYDAKLAADQQRARDLWRAQQRIRQLELEQASRDPNFQKQLELETKAVEKAIERCASISLALRLLISRCRYRKLQKEVEKLGKGAAMKPAQHALLSWFQPLIDAVRKEQHDIETGRCTKPGHNIYGTYLRLLKPEKLAVVSDISLGSSLDCILTPFSWSFFSFCSY